MRERGLRVLQLTGDWKWTGPAEPMLQLALALRERGIEVELACPEAPPGAARSLAGEARAAGLPPALALSRGRGARWLRDRADAARLRAHVASRGVDVVHCWHTRDHVLALRAAGARRPRSPRLVRSVASADPIAPRPWNRWLFGPGADAVLCPSPASALRYAALRGGRAIAGHFGAVDVARFRAGPPDPAVRRGLGLEAGHRVVGIAARVQPHRRFDLLLEAAARLFERDPAARLLVIGRGTRRAELAERPAERLGIADRVVFAGYRSDDYGDVLRAIDVFTLLVPGSDPSCRALLEAAACGIPAVTTRRGARPEIVADGETGLVAAETPEALAAAWQRLLSNAEERLSMGAAARRRAEACFAPARLAEEVAALYASALG